MEDNFQNTDLSHCWKAFTQGDKQAFAEIHKTHFAMLYNYALKMQFGNEALSDDSVQELFIKLWVKRDNLPQVKSVKAYIITSLRRHILNNTRNRHLAESKGLVLRQPGIEFSQDEIVMKKEEDSVLRSKILGLISTLPKRQKEVVYLHYFAGMNHYQIASVMSINYQSVSNLKQKAIEKMRCTGLL